MKRSILLSVLILLLGIVPGMIQQNRLVGLRHQHQQVVMEAAKLGLSINASTDARGPHFTKRQREERQRLVESTASDIIAFAKARKTGEEIGGNADETTRSRGMAMVQKLMDLDGAQLKDVIARLRESDEMDASTRGNIIAFSMLMLADDHPESVLAIYAESSDLLDQSFIGSNVIPSALQRWAEFSPDAALAWIRSNSEKYPKIANDDTKCGVIAGASLNDPKRAFQLIAELKLEDPTSAIQAILSTGPANQERRDAVLSALRNHLGTIQNEEQLEEMRASAYGSFANIVSDQGFDSANQWMNAARFSATEKAEFASGLSYFNTKGDTGKWIDWIATNLSEEDGSGPVGQLVAEWTQQDYQTAGKWLSTAADGPAKSAAIQAYAEAVAEYEPQVATQWALTLPPGPQRDATLRLIHENWSNLDPEGAINFAREHHLESE